MTGSSLMPPRTKICPLTHLFVSPDKKTQRYQERGEGVNYRGERKKETKTQKKRKAMDWLYKEFIIKLNE